MPDTDIQALERQLRHLEGRIEDLESRLANAGTGLARQYDADLDALRERHKRAESELSRLRLTDAESWEDEDIFAIFDDIGRRLDRLFSRLSG